MSTKVNIYYLGALLSILFLSVISHTFFSIPPNLPIISLSFFLMLLDIIRTNRVVNNYIFFQTSIFLIFLVVTQVFLDTILYRFLGLVFSIAVILPIIHFGKSISQAQFQSLTNKFFSISIIILAIEGIYRFLNPVTFYDQFIGVDSRWIYRYKFGGIMYTDSNAVGLHLIAVLFFYLYWIKSRKAASNKFILLILLVLIAFTFSRAAWIATVIGLIYFIFFKGEKIKLFFIYSFTILLVSSTSLILYLKSINDLSLLSKFFIIEETIKAFSNSSIINILIGHGFFNSEKILGIYGHNIFIVYLLESGIIGFFLYLATLFSFIRMTGSRIFILFIPYFTASLSATTTYIPYFYGIIGLIYLNERFFINEK